MKITAFDRQEGTIGDDLVVRPPPVRLRKKISRLKRDFPQSNRSDLEYTYYHVVYKKKEMSINGTRDSKNLYGFIHFSNLSTVVIVSRDNCFPWFSSAKRQKQAVSLWRNQSTAKDDTSPNFGRLGLRHVHVRYFFFNSNLRKLKDYFVLLHQGVEDHRVDKTVRFNILECRRPEVPIIDQSRS